MTDLEKQVLEKLPPEKREIIKQLYEEINADLSKAEKDLAELLESETVKEVLAKKKARESKEKQG